MRLESLPVTVKRLIPDAKIPVQYASACTALAECRGIDEAKYWDNKADALAAWAKIYKSPQAAVESKRLKLHAYRRMGELALELRPTTYRKGQPKIAGAQLPGPHTLLREHGLSKREAYAARRLAILDGDSFAGLTNLPRPPSPSAVVNCNTNSDEGRFMQAIQMLAFYCKRIEAAQMAAFVEKSDRYAWREHLPIIVDWLDEFEQRLQKRFQADGEAG